METLTKTLTWTKTKTMTLTSAVNYLLLASFLLKLSLKDKG